MKVLATLDDSLPFPLGDDGKIINPVLDPNLQGMSGESFIGGFLSAAIELILIAGVVIAFFLLLIGGIQWMLSGGDKTATEAARGRITSAIIGLLLLFSAWAIILLIESFLGITIFGGPITLPKI
ncbi:MAG: hypothetical protein Q8Q15_01955 [bacterium]|nr:hypothetical protein [bacterium]